MEDPSAPIERKQGESKLTPGDGIDVQQLFDSSMPPSYDVLRIFICSAHVSVKNHE